MKQSFIESVIHVSPLIERHCSGGEEAARVYVIAFGAFVILRWVLNITVLDKVALAISFLALAYLGVHCIS